MFVYLLVNIKRGTQLGEPKLSRPASWDAKEVSHNACGPQFRDGKIGRGEDEEAELWKIRAVLAEQYVKSDPTRYATLTEEQATGIIALCRQARNEDPDAELVACESKLHAIDVKLRAKAAGYAIDLTERDLKALDPQDPEPGINATPKDAAVLYRDGTPADDAEAIRIEAVRQTALEKVP